MPPLSDQSSPSVDHSAFGPAQPQRGGDRPAFFVVHGLGCRTIFPRRLAQHLKNELAFYAFEPPGMDGRESPLTSIEAMAERYLETVSAIQPKGPYLLSGFCAGGHIAMEMAHRLAAAGEEIAHLFLIDTPVSLGKEPFQALIKEQIAIVENLMTLRPGASRLTHVPETILAFAQALRSYQPRFFNGKAHLLASRELATDMTDPEKGWSRFLRPETVLTVVAPTRAAIVFEKMHVVAGVIRRELTRSQPGFGGNKALRATV